MLTRRSLKLKKFFDIKRNFNGKAQSLIQLNVFNLSDKRKKLPETKPFLKNILIKQFNNEFFYLPDVQPFERYKEFESWLTQIDDYIKNAERDKKLDKKDILSTLSNHNVFRAYISEEYDGMNLLETESLKLIETVSTLPWLGTYLVKNLMLPVRVISKYGTDSQKEKYFPKIMNGEIIPTICLKEKNNGTNILHNSSYATPINEESWSLNGEKKFVFNGTSANLFLVFAKTNPVEVINSNNISLFLVDRNSNGITCTETCEIIGRHKVPVCSVSFENTTVPSTNILAQSTEAFNIMMDLLKPGNQNTAAQSIAILKRLIKHLIPDILEMKHYDKDFYKFDLVTKVLAETTQALYTMESMAYLTSKLVDVYENQDIELERIATEMYCANKCLSSIQSVLQLMGAQIYMNNTSYMDVYHSALALTTFDTNNLDAQIYIATSLIKHLGNYLYEDVMKLRNQSKYPIFSIMKHYKQIFFEEVLSIKCFHPSLELAVVRLMDCMKQVKHSIETLMLRHGSKLMNNHADLLRVSQMMLELYTMIANVSRASKSYTDGHRYSDVEKDIVMSMIHHSYATILNISQEIEQDEVVNGDRYNKSIVDLIYNQRKYPIEHPVYRLY